MTFDDFYWKVLETFPEAYIGEDNDGQLVIYTDLTINDADEVVPCSDVQ